MNIPDMLELPDFSLDDVEADARGNLYVSNSAQRNIIKLDCSSGAPKQIISGTSGPAVTADMSLKLAATPDSILYVADTAQGLIARYDENGEFLGEFPSAGVLGLCHGADDVIYALSNDEDIERINSYDQLGQIDTLPAPARYRAHLDPVLVSLDSDADGNIYVSYGMPPYRLWKVKADGSEMEAWTRQIDYPEDVILISDLAFDRNSGILWVLLAHKEFGLQMLDAFTPDGEFLGSTGIPHSSNLYGAMCTCDSALYLLNTGTGPGAGDLTRVVVSSR